MKYNSKNRRGALRGPLAGFTEADMATVKSFHRGDGIITLHDGSNGMRVLRTRDAMETPRSMLSDYLDEPLPIENLYFPINGRHERRPISENISRLNSVFADIDYTHDAAPDADRIEREIARFGMLVAEHVFPPPTYIVRSGQGVWLHYLLREPDSDRSVVRCPETAERWTEAERALLERLADNGFPADPAARMLTQLCRVPNSINTDSGSRVAYTANYGINGQPLLNTLTEVLAALGVTQPRWHSFTQTPARAERDPDRPRVPNRKAGRIKVRANRERQFWLAVKMRGNEIRRPDRDRFAFVYCAILYGDPERAKKVRTFCKLTCRPALTDSEIGSALLKKPIYKITNRKIAERLNLTHAERTRLEIDRLRTVPAPRPNKGRTPAQLRRRHNVIRAAISCYVTNGMKPTTIGQIVSSIRGAGVNVSDRTILRDLRALNLGWSCTSV
jgi:hypothetical protein